MAVKTSPSELDSTNTHRNTPDSDWFGSIRFRGQRLQSSSNLASFLHYSDRL